MIELGQLERRHQDFAKQNVRVVVVSLEGHDEAEKTQAQFPHLMAVADGEHHLIDAAGVLHPHANPEGGDAAAPTTILIDRDGIVRWLFRPSRYLTRLSPDELLEAVQQHRSQ